LNTRGKVSPPEPVKPEEGLPEGQWNVSENYAGLGESAWATEKAALLKANADHQKQVEELKTEVEELTEINNSYEGEIKQVVAQAKAEAYRDIIQAMDNEVIKSDNEAESKPFPNTRLNEDHTALWRGYSVALRDTKQYALLKIEALSGLPLEGKWRKR
jgi:hypothetical protein